MWSLYASWADYRAGRAGPFCPTRYRGNGSPELCSTGAGARSLHGVPPVIPAQWLPSLPPPANGWHAVYYEVSEEGGILRQGEYRVDGDRVWARNDVGVRFLPRERHLADVVVARRVLRLLDHGL